MRKRVIIFFLGAFFFLPFKEMALGQDASPAVSVAVTVSPLIDKTYYSDLKQFLSFYIKENTNLKETTQKADYTLSLNVIRTNMEYKVVTSLLRKGAIIEQGQRDIDQFFSFFSQTSFLLDSLLRKEGLLKKVPTRKTLDILLAIGNQKQFTKEVSYINTFSNKIFSKLLYNTQSYDVSYNLMFFRSNAIAQETTNQSRQFKHYHNFLEDQFSSLLSNSLKNSSYSFANLISYIVHEYPWRSDYKMAVIFLSNSVDLSYEKKIKAVLKEAYKRHIVLQFVFIDNISNTKKREFAQLINVPLKDIVSLQYKSVFLMQNGNSESFIFDAGTVYKETLSQEGSSFSPISTQGILQSYEEMKDYLIKQGYPIKKTLFSDISLPETLGLVTNFISPTLNNVYLFKSGSDYIMVKDLPIEILANLVIGKSYIVKGSPFLYNNQLFLKNGSFDLAKNTPPAFLMTTVKKVFSTPSFYGEQGVSKDLSWYFKVTYLGAHSFDED
jgi:hypothetical protein